MFDQLLQTKLALPPIRPFLVHRPHLINKLNQAIAHDTALGGKLTLVSAPAGFGKTTLIAHWLRQIPHSQVAWLSLDTDDNDLARFFTYFVAALTTFCTDNTLPLSRPPQELPTAKLALTPLLNQLQQTSQPAILVLDDYQHITTPDIHALLAFFLEQMPFNLRLIFATRSDPPLPLARLRVRGQLAELRAAHLRFSAEETAVFFHQFMQLDIPPETIAALNEQTQGWVAGLQLAGLAMQANGLAALPAAYFDGTDETVTSYLLQEVLLQQPPELQTFLRYTSIPERLCADLCAALVSTAVHTPTTDLLTQILQTNLFLVPLDGRSQWFQYLPIFRQFLQRQLQQTAPEKVAELHRRTAAWMAANGFTDTAVHHYLQAGDEQSAAQQMTTVIATRMQHGEIGTVSRWLNRLPEATIWANPPLALAQLWLFASTGQPAAILAQAQQFTDKPQSAETYAMLALAAAMHNQPEKASVYAQAAETKAVTNKDAQVQAYVSFALAAAYKTSRAFAKAEAAFLRTEILAAQAGLTNIQFSAIANLGDMQYELGQLKASAHTCRQALNLPWPDIETAHPMTGWMHWSLGRIALEWNQLAEAQEHAARSVPLCQEWGHIGMATRGQVLQASIARAHGNWTAAQSMLDYAEQLAQQGNDGRFLATVTYQRLLLALNQQDIHAARYWASHLQAQTDAPAATRHVAQARLALAEHRPETALSHLQTARQLFADMQFVPALLKVLLLTAVAQQQQGGQQQAQQTWQEALALAEAGGFIRTLMDEGDGVIRLLARVTAVTPYQAQLLAALNPDTPPPAIDLTPREQEILRLLAAGFSNQAVAAQLVIAESTAKRHISNLYLKLNVHSRTEAISCATALGLL